MNSYILRLKNTKPKSKVRILALVEAKSLPKAVDELKAATGFKHITENDVTLLCESKLGE